MNQKNIDDINKYTSPNYCLFVGANGKLVKIKTPFKVKCIRKVSSFLVGDVLQVMQVKSSFELKTIYIIGNKPYHHSFFCLKE
jgi:hypothetical protein